MTHRRRMMHGALVISLLCIVLIVLLAMTAGCGAHVSGALDTESSVGSTRLSGSTDTGVCGEFKPRKFPLGLLVCYDTDGKARVCVTSPAGELACYERPL